MKRIAAMIIVALLLAGTALGEGITEAVYILCQPDSFVNIRAEAVKNADVIGRYELGQEVETDGKRRNGFLHLISLSLEDSDGWINVGFVAWYPVTIETVKATVKARGRVACRRSAGGTRRKWLKNGCEVTVYAHAADWSVTSQGFIQTKFLSWE